MQIEAENIKNSLLEKLKFFNNGFANVYLDETASKYVSLDGKENIALGVDDRYANYFYIRSSGDIRINKSRQQLVNCSTTIEMTSSMVLFANIQKGNPEKLLECLINALLISVGEDFEITRAETTNEKVIKSEYIFLGLDAVKSILLRTFNRTFVKIEFTLFKEMQPNDKSCYTCNPCIDC